MGPKTNWLAGDRIMFCNVKEPKKATKGFFKLLLLLLKSLVWPKGGQHIRPVIRNEPSTGNRLCFQLLLVSPGGYVSVRCAEAGAGRAPRFPQHSILRNDAPRAPSPQPSQESRAGLQQKRPRLPPLCAFCDAFCRKHRESLSEQSSPPSRRRHRPGAGAPNPDTVPGWGADVSALRSGWKPPRPRSPRRRRLTQLMDLTEGSQTVTQEVPPRCLFWLDLLEGGIARAAPVRDFKGNKRLNADLTARPPN